jgi:hypothetical protein
MRNPLFDRYVLSQCSGMVCRDRVSLAHRASYLGKEYGHVFDLEARGLDTDGYEVHRKSGHPFYVPSSLSIPVSKATSNF